jgi:hypothetical protein
MNPEDIAHYLRNNPGFFEQFADMMAEVCIPHPHGGRTISITERQLITLRDKNRTLETRLRELISFAEQNDAISDKVHRLSLAMMDAPSLDALLHTVALSLREDFAVPHAALRCWNLGHAAGSRPEFVEPAGELTALAEKLVHPHCGPEVAAEVLSWFGEDGARLKSFALLPLKGETAFGLLVLASEDAHRFYPEMGTLYLSRIAELVSHALLRFRADA